MGHEPFRSFALGCLARHTKGDWGDLKPEEIQANEDALQTDARLLSSYNLPEEIKAPSDDRIWIITEADRSATTLLFPNDY